MLAITNAQGLTLDLPTGQRLTIEQSAGWLTDDTLPGAFSYPVEFPLNDRNEQFLQGGYRPSAAAVVMELPVSVQLSGVLYRQCVFSYRIVDGKGAGYLKIDAGEAFPTLRGLKLLDVFSEPIRLETGVPGSNLADTLKNLAELPPGSVPAVFFPIRNDGFFEKELTGTPDQKDTVCLPNFSRQPYLNAYPTNGFLTDTEIRLGYPLCPQFYLAWVLDRIFAQAGYRIAGDWCAHEETRRLTILNLTGIRTLWFPEFPVNANPVFLPAVAPGLYLPDMTVADLLKALRTRYGLVYSFNANSRVCTIRRLVDVGGQQAAQELSQYMAGRYGIEAPMNPGGYSVYDYIDSADELYKIPDAGKPVIPGQPVATTLYVPPAFIIGTGETEVKLSVGTTEMVYEATAPGSGKRILPAVRMAGNTEDPAYTVSTRSLDESGKRRNSFGFRLLSYRGMQPDSANVPYPLGTADTDNARNQEVGSRGTALGGPSGTWAQSGRLFWNFRAETRRVTQPLRMPAAALSQFTLHDPVRLSLDQDYAATRFVTDKLLFGGPRQDGTVSINAEFLTLPSGLNLPALTDQAPPWVELTQTIVTVERIAVFASRSDDNNTGGFFTGDRYVYRVELNLWTTSAKTTRWVSTSGPITINLFETQNSEDRSHPLAIEFERIKPVLIAQSGVILPFYRIRDFLLIDRLATQKIRTLALMPAPIYRLL